jgi:hypothetical protein
LGSPHIEILAAVAGQQPAIMVEAGLGPMVARARNLAGEFEDADVARCYRFRASTQFCSFADGSNGELREQTQCRHVAHLLRASGQVGGPRRLKMPGANREFGLEPPKAGAPPR